MVGPRLFRSRWSALIWAGGILWTAYDVANAAAPDPGTQQATDTTTASNAAAPDAIDATGMAVDAKDLAVLADLGNAP